MVYKHFFWGIFFRVTLIVFTSLLFAFLFYEFNDLLINLNLLGLLIIETYLLVRYVNRTNRDLTNFFMAVKSEDTTITYSSKFKGKSFQQLYEQMDMLNQHIKKIKINLINQEQFNQIIISHLNTGILVLDENGKIKLYNKALSEIFSIPVITNVAQLKKVNPALPEILNNIHPGQEETMRIMTGSKSKEILLKSSIYKQSDVIHRLISFQDIKYQLDEKEMESWQKLIRILTHEITNSIGPINSTIDTLADLYFENTEEHLNPLPQINQKTVNDTIKGVKIIKERTIGLLEFVQKFRDLTLLPKPTIIPFRVKSFFEQIEYLMGEDIRQKNVGLSFTVNPKDLNITADKSLISQVMINLIKNSIESGARNINIESKFDEGGGIVVTVKDDGGGIPIEDLDHIFIPFYTTKDHGSGIGLSLSREIMRMHKGSISVLSEPGKGSVFSLIFSRL